MYNTFYSGDQFLSVDEMAAFIHPEEFHHTKDLALQESMNVSLIVLSVIDRDLSFQNYYMNA